ncbi:hypothetical protein BBO99_00004481 [Phytophthora kernoviae]|uniref:DNA/RNA-binding protein Alba-like domain-containing protein n=2 Tax=Phytophthora kernoviae TaxID=325452 RepID=A0A3R7KK34_9STRA|nr:hypothetical protein G195_004506 [Phytophthora kernoviae 00238/432]KAG2525772.1 hypothetical protein JM16_004236 [Phytophthora kernoviae]KAG2527557.1 hypothetical protein JM18_003758 [Phytophthora kernoviae]RLN14088.1 hypothetical protein BBI17_004576 [Phytophthora kernoviae]RLN80455.1 hypothetical protein BBO99_00004481 [Phytophthora kernoviae]
MDKYRRVEKPRREEQPTPVEPNEIRITQQGKEKSERLVVLKAMGNAISKAVTVAEILKHRVQNLHQITRLSSIETVDVYEPLEEGLDRIETKRHIPGISIELSLDQLDRDDPGYQSPIPPEQVTATSPTFHDGREFRKSRGHGKRGGKNSGHGVVEPAVVGDAEPAAEGDSTQDNEAESGQQIPGEDDTSTPTTRGKRGKGRGRGRTSNGRNRKPRGKNPVAEEGDGRDPEPATETGAGAPKQVESETPSASSNRKSRGGRKTGKKDSGESNGDENKQLEERDGDNGTRENGQNVRGGRAGHSGRGRGRSRGRGRGGRGEGNGREAAPAAATTAATE